MKLMIVKVDLPFLQVRISQVILELVMVLLSIKAQELLVETFIQRVYSRT